MKVGILGGGQLAKMLSIAANNLGIEVICIDPDPTSCATQVSDVLHVVYQDVDAIRHYFQDVNCVTIETENLPIKPIEAIADHFSLYPSLESFRITQDRLLEKNLLKKLAIPTVNFHEILGWEHLLDLVTSSKKPLLLKTCQGGYDGKGQFVVKNTEDAQLAWNSLVNHRIIAEELCQFDAEVSLIAARSRSGEFAFYPLTKNTHKDGILRLSTAPIPNDHLVLHAQQHAQTLMSYFNYVGVITIEFFVQGDNLLVNEIAPRVHNSGHWTIEGAKTSQFENHLRAILDLPLGSTEAMGYNTMINIISKLPDSLPSTPGVYPHIYGKEARQNRKLGHITIHTDDEIKMNELVLQIESYL